LVAGGDRPATPMSTTTDHLLFGGAERFGSGALAEDHRGLNEQGESTQLKLFPNDAGASRRPECRPGASEEGSCRTNATVWRLLILDWSCGSSWGWRSFLPDIWTRRSADVPCPAWPRCWRSTGCVLQVANWPSTTTGIRPQHWNDLLHIAKGKINDTRLYRCLDRLLPLKNQDRAAS